MNLKVPGFLLTAFLAVAPPANAQNIKIEFPKTPGELMTDGMDTVLFSVQGTSMPILDEGCDRSREGEPCLTSREGFEQYHQPHLPADFLLRAADECGFGTAIVNMDGFDLYDDFKEEGNTELNERIERQKTRTGLPGLPKFYIDGEKITIAYSGAKGSLDLLILIGRYLEQAPDQKAPLYLKLDVDGQYVRAHVDLDKTFGKETADAIRERYKDVRNFTEVSVRVEETQYNHWNDLYLWLDIIGDHLFSVYKDGQIPQFNPLFTNEEDAEFWAFMNGAAKQCFIEGGHAGVEKWWAEHGQRLTHEFYTQYRERGKGLPTEMRPDPADVAYPNPLMPQ